METATSRQGGLADALWNDPRVREYAREGSFGYLHHSIRNAAADEMLLQVAIDAEYDHEALVGLLISRIGRIAGDEMTFDDRATRLRRYLAAPSTRGECRIAARNYAEELEEGSR